MRYGPTFFRRKETYEKSSVQEAVFRAACADNGGRSAARVSAGGGGRQCGFYARAYGSSATDGIG